MKKLMTEYLIDKKDLNERIAYIKDSDDCYVSENGNIYREYQPNKFLKKKLYVNPNNQYIYCGILYSGNMKTTRVHRLVATYFVENTIPSNDVIGHKDNNKSNNVYTNLYWTNTSENTKKAFDDGLAYNTKGFDDSQSMSVAVFDINKNFIEFVGSFRLTAAKYGVSVSTVSRQCNHTIKTKPRCGYYFRFKNEYDSQGFVL